MNEQLELKAFERWIREHTAIAERNLRRPGPDRPYNSANVQSRWLGWLARAKLMEVLSEEEA